MKFIDPAPIGDSQLFSTNVENDANIPVWTSGENIIAGNERRYEAPNKHWIVIAKVNHVAGLSNAPQNMLTDPYWTFKYETNPRRMFDNSSSSQSTQLNSIDTTLAITRAINSLAFINVECRSIQVIMYNFNGDEVFNKEYTMIRDDLIYDWWTYLFTPIQFKTDLIVTDLPIHNLSSIRVIIKNPGAIAKCGALVVGQLVDAGESQYGLKRGIRDFSTKTADDFGNYIITKRIFSKTMTIATKISSARFSELVDKLDTLRATPTVYLGADDYTATFIYGFYKDCYAIADFVSMSEMNFEIEGLA